MIQEMHECLRRQRQMRDCHTIWMVKYFPFDFNERNSFFSRELKDNAMEHPRYAYTLASYIIQNESLLYKDGCYGNSYHMNRYRIFVVVFSPKQSKEFIIAY